MAKVILTKRMIERTAGRVVRAGRHQMREQRAASQKIALKPPVPQPQLRKIPGVGDGPMIGEESGTTSDDAAPLPHELELSEGREHLGQAGDDDLLNRRIAALGIGGNAVERAAEHDLALVGLARIDAPSPHP